MVPSHCAVQPVGDAFGVALLSLHTRTLTKQQTKELGFDGTASPREIFRFFTAGTPPANARWSGFTDGKLPPSKWVKKRTSKKPARP